MAAVLATGITLAAGLYVESVHRARQQRVQALRAEQQQIESELRKVKAIADDMKPVVVLEKGNTRVIVDLNEQLVYY